MSLAVFGASRTIRSTKPRTIASAANGFARARAASRIAAMRASF
jgi:hypothetical protein